MTKVDKYLNKYLDGSITEPEMQDFRDLLESEPHLQTEMRQILDLRSLVHDDLLELNPPQFLSDSVRMMVGEQFAALAEEALPEEEEEKRRPIFFTERIGGSFVMAMVALFLVALAPTLIAPSGSTTEPNADIAALEQVVPDVSQDAENGSPIVRPNTVQQDQNRQRGSNRAAIGSTNEDVAGTLAQVSESSESTDDRELRTSDNEMIAEVVTSTDQAPAHQSAEANGAMVTDHQASHDIDGKAAQTLGLPQRLDLLFATANNDGAALERERRLSSSYNREADMIEQTRSPEQTAYIASITPTLPNISQEAQEAGDKNASKPRLAFGFTVGAGGLTNSPASLALTGGAGYAALSLSESNRIGIEAGGSKFRSSHTIYTQEPLGPLSKSNANGTNVWGTSANGGTVAGIYQIYGNGGSGNQNNGTIVPQSRPRNTNPTQIDDVKGDRPEFFGERISPPPPSVNSPGSTIQTETYESDTAMGYGMLFYDRRVVSLSDELNIRSRVGLGGTDGGLIVDLRAYAAFATNENVAITLGVGGSALRELSQDGKLSANYGVQVGAEVGF